MKNLNELAENALAVSCFNFSSNIVAASRSKAIKPKHLTNALYGTIGAAVANISDDQWAEMMKPSKPCGNPGCNCHQEVDDFMKSMDAFRTVAKTEIEKQLGHQSHCE